MPDRRFDFVESPNGPLFVATTSPPKGTTAKGSILYLHPFGEEMNKARRLVAMQSRAFASLGYTVKTLDLPGCGDSYGFLEEVTWKDWLDAAKSCLDPLIREAGHPVILWGLRMGALLCAEVASERKGMVDRLVFWHPVLDGKSVISSLFRLARAGGLLRRSDTADPSDDPRKLLQERSMVEIGGYCISEPLVSSMEQRSLSDITTGPLRIDWIDVSSRDSAKPSFAAERVIRKLETRGATVRWSHARGDAFWNTVEITDCPALIDATCHTVEKAPNHDA